jgi:hypothetical protein
MLSCSVPHKVTWAIFVKVRLFHKIVKIVKKYREMWKKCYCKIEVIYLFIRGNWADMQRSKFNLENQACSCFSQWKIKFDLKQELNTPAQDPGHHYKDNKSQWLIAQLVERSLSVMKDLGSNLGMYICSFCYWSVI